MPEFKELLRYGHPGFNLAEIEPRIVANFDEERLQHLPSRWLAKPHFAAKSELLKEAIHAFMAGKPVTVIKILLTEIEGVLNDAYRAAHGGQGAKLKELLAFAEVSAARRAHDAAGVASDPNLGPACLLHLTDQMKDMSFSRTCCWNPVVEHHPLPLPKN